MGRGNERLQIKIATAAAATARKPAAAAKSITVLSALRRWVADTSIDRMSVVTRRVWKMMQSMRAARLQKSTSTRTLTAQKTIDARIDSWLFHEHVFTYYKCLDFPHKSLLIGGNMCCMGLSYAIPRIEEATPCSNYYTKYLID